MGRSTIAPKQRPVFVELRSLKVVEGITVKDFAEKIEIKPKDVVAEMLKRGVITRTRPSTGADPATGDILFFAPPLVVTEADVDRLVAAARDAVMAVAGALC